jgi:transposase
MARVEVITGPECRRRWSDEQKRAIVAASLEPGAVVADVARRAEVGADQIYRWRQQFARSDGFAQVLIAPPEAASARTVNEAACAEPMVEIEFAGKTRVRIPGSIPAALATAVVKALARR